MEMTAAAQGLNEFFFGYDSAILGFMHTLAEKMGGLLTPLMKIITFLGEKGILFFLLALVCMCFARRRDFGVCLFGAVCCGALITNIILKDNIARPRPFETVEQFRQWWQFVGAPAEEGFSFPSGHVTAAAAGMTAISLMKGKKYIAPSVVVVLLMAMARNYLMAHYPSDVLAAAVIGVASGFIAWFITKLIYRFLEEHDDNTVCAIILDADAAEFIPPAVMDKLDAVLGIVKDKLSSVWLLVTGLIPGRGAKNAAPQKKNSREAAAENGEKKILKRTVYDDGSAYEPEQPARSGGRHSKAPEKTAPISKMKLKGLNTGYKGKHEK